MADNVNQYDNGGGPGPGGSGNGGGPGGPAALAARGEAAAIPASRA